MSFLIAIDGKIEKTYAKVKPAEHAQQVLADLQG
jgi:peroxiredoxin